MGKYMRSKCRGPAGDSKAAPAAVLGVRTRSRAATAAVVAGATPAKRRKQAEAATTAAARVEADDALPGQDGRPAAAAAAAGCYLHLRSRRLFMPAVARRGDSGAETARLDSSVASGEAVVVGISQCSSTASSTVDVAARRRRGGEAEACESRDVGSSVSDSECGGRERRESTPSSRPPVDFSDLDSSQALATDDQNPKRRRYQATATFHLGSRARMPAAAEIEEFFAAAEKAQAERFAAEYNFDVTLGMPLKVGRFEWTPAATT